MRIGIRIGAPLDFSRYEGMEEDRFVLRSITDEIMYELMLLSDQEYVDVYAASMKDRLVAAARAKAKELQREGHDRSAAAAAAQAKAVAGTASTSEDPAATAGTGPLPAPPTGSPGAPPTDAGDAGERSGQLGRCPPGGCGRRGCRPVRRWSPRSGAPSTSCARSPWAGRRTAPTVRSGSMTRPWLAWTVLGVLAAWTVGHARCAARAPRRCVGTELALAVLAILATRLVDTARGHRRRRQDRPGHLAGGHRRGAGRCCAGGAAACSPRLSSPRRPTWSRWSSRPRTPSTTSSCCSCSAAASATAPTCPARATRRCRRRCASRREVRERDRLARTVHDGVLQTLSYIHRRGTDMGGEARELAAMAADQERLLRTLVSGVSTPPPDQVVEGEVDVRGRPRALRRGRRAGRRPGRRR